MKYLAYLFDLDGTLVTTEGLKASAFEHTCLYFGGHIDPLIYCNYLGQSWEVVSNKIQDHANISVENRLFENKFHEIYHSLIEISVEPTPGVLKFIESAITKGVKIGLVSSSAKRSIDIIISKLNIGSYFDIIVSHEDVQNKKPHPDGYILAANRLKVSPRKALVFEDTSPGFESAYRAGCDVVAINHKLNHNIDKSRTLQSIADFRELCVKNGNRLIF